MTGLKVQKLSRTNAVNFSTYLGVVVFYVAVTLLSGARVLNRSMTGLLVPDLLLYVHGRIPETSPWVSSVSWEPAATPAL